MTALSAMLGESVQRIGIDDGGVGLREQRADQRRRFRAARNAGTDGERALAFQGSFQRLEIPGAERTVAGQRDRHHFRQQPGEHFGPRGERDQARAGAQRAFADHRRGAALSL